MQSNNTLSPFEYLCGLEKKIIARGVKTPYQTLKKHWVGLSFLSGSYFLITPLEEVESVFPATDITPLPGVKPWLRGMVAFHQEVFPVTDLSGFLGNKMTNITKYSRIIMVRVKEGYVGLLVNRVLNLQRIALEDKKEDNVKGLMPEFDPFIQGSIKLSNTQLPVISCRSIVEDPQFQNVLLSETGEERE